MGGAPVPRSIRWHVVGMLLAVPMLAAAAAVVTGNRVGAEMVEAGRMWWDGHVPLWTEAQGLGRPLVGDGGSWVFYPSIVLYGLVAMRWAWAIDVLLHLALVGFGVWVLAKRAGWPGRWAILGGIASQVIVAVMLWLDVRAGHVAALLPWVMVGVMGLAARPEVWRLIGVMLLMTLASLAGPIMPAVAVAGIAMAVAILLIVRPVPWCAQTTRRQRAAALPLLIVCASGALLLSGVHWVPRIYFERMEEREKLVAASQDWLKTLPRMWTVRSAQTAELPGDAGRRVADGRADPKIVVVLDRQVDEFYAQPSEYTTNLVRTGGASRREPVVNVVEDRPGMLRVKVSNPSGWLVISGAYAQGWRGRLEATSVSRRGEQRVVDSDAVVLPAYGVLRAMPLTALGGMEVEAEMRYWPVGWRRGMLVSGLGLVLLVLLAGLRLMNERARQSPKSGIENM